MNSFQCFEVSINFICNQVVKRLRTMTTLKDKETLFFDIVRRFNDEQAKTLKVYYKNLNTKGKQEFFDDVDKYGIYIHEKIFWDKEPLFDRINQLYKDYDWIKPVDVYVNKWGRKIKIMKPMIIGELYMIKLKQSSKKGFSARSTGALSKRGVPEKSTKTKIHQDLYSSTPIRIGDQENINSLIGVDASDIAKLHMFYRSSVIGRKDLGKKLATTIKTLKDFKYDKDFKNRNVEILQAYLKAMGLRIEFIGDEYNIDIKNNYLESFDTADGLFIGTRSEHDDIKLKEKIKKKYKDRVCIVDTEDKLEEILENEFQNEKMKQEYYMIDIKL